MFNKQIDIVIVNWNAGTLLKKCVDSILNIENIEVINKIFILDNASKDDSLKLISSHPKLEIIYNKRNNGFAKAANQGFKLSQSEYVLLLNPDTQLFADTLTRCISLMNHNIQIDILGCQLYDVYGKTNLSCARFPKPITYFYDAVGLSRLAPKIFTPALLMSDWDHKSDRYVDQIIGAFMFMRRSVFDKIGYFDEQFFVYSEELDFSKRLANAGGKSFHKADIGAIHIGGGTTRNVKAYRLFLNLKSRLLYAKKHFSFSGYLFTKFVTMVIEPVCRFFFFLFKGDSMEIKELIKGYRFLFTKKDLSNPD